MANGPPSSSGAVVNTVPIFPLRNSVVFPMRSCRSTSAARGACASSRICSGRTAPSSASSASGPRPRRARLRGHLRRRHGRPRREGHPPRHRNYSVVLHGLGRFRIAAPGRARAVHARQDPAHRRRPERDAALDALGAQLREATRELLELMPNLPKETAGILDNVRESGRARRPHRVEPHERARDRRRQAEGARGVRRQDRVRLVLAMVQRQLEMLA